MKRTISFVLSMFLIFAVLPITAFAAENEQITAYEAIYNGLINADESISISQYSLTSNELSDIVDDIHQNEPMLFYFVGGYRYYMLSQYVYSIIPNYSYDANAITEATAFVESEINAILATVPNGLSDLQKALYLHDYICTHFEYDLDYENYDIHVMLRDKKGVCQAYSLLYDELLQRVGIDSRPVISNSLNHRWNEILIDGKWYHVDVTWDDPVKDLFSRARHEYFLLSDGASKAVHENATDIVADYSCSDTSYDSFAWHNSDSSAAFVNGNTYMANGSDIQLVNLKTGKTEVVYTISDKWNLPDGYYYTSSFMRLGTYNNKIIYNTDKKIMALDLNSMIPTVIYAPSLGNKNIYGITISGNVISYLTAVYTSDEGVISTYTIEENSSDSYVLGDLSGNGKLEAVDYLILKRVVFGLVATTADIKTRGDMTGDGKITAADYLKLKKVLLGA